MAKTESTAVNQLISSVQAGKPIRDPSDDLFSAPRPPASRVASPVPPMRTAGEVAPLPRGRAPTGTSQHKLPPPVRVTTAPPHRAQSIPPLPRSGAKATMPPPRPAAPVPPPPPSIASGTPAPELMKPAARPPSPEDNPFVARPVQAPALPPARPLSVDETGDVVSADLWFEPSRMVDKVEDEQWLGTAPTPRTRRRGSLAKKLIVPIAAVVCVGAAVAVYVMTQHAPGAPAAAAQAATATPAHPAPAAVAQRDVTTALPPTPSTEPANAATASAGATAPEPPAPAGQAPAPAPVEQAPAPAPSAVAAAVPAAPDQAVHEIATPHPAAQLVDVRIDSRPAGATAMLVDNGKTSFLGTTPVSASVDPGHPYDVILTLEGHPTQMAHFDPAHTRHVDVQLAKGMTVAKTTTATPAPSVQAAQPARHHHAAPAPSHAIGSLAEPSFDSGAPATHATPAVRAAPAAHASGTGTLMVSSKPPCQIYIDGRATGLVTPQRSIELSPGLHKITFVNGDAHVKKTLAVAIKASQSTKLIQNFMP